MGHNGISDNMIRYMGLFEENRTPISHNLSPCSPQEKLTMLGIYLISRLTNMLLNITQFGNYMLRIDRLKVYHAIRDMRAFTCHHSMMGNPFAMISVGTCFKTTLIYSNLQRNTKSFVSILVEFYVSSFFYVGSYYRFISG